MKLVSMKLTKAEAKAEVSLSPPKPPQYSYGLCLHLDEDALDKLGIDDPDVGQEVTIQAKGIVTAYRESERQGRDRDCEAEIQITDLAIEEAPAKKRERRESETIKRAGGGY